MNKMYVYTKSVLLAAFFLTTITSTAKAATAVEYGLLLPGLLPFIQINQYVGEIRFLAGVNAPVFPIDMWVPCDGSLHSSTDPNYESLFNEIGYRYGGSNGTFALPKIPKYPQLTDWLGVATLKCYISLGGITSNLAIP